MTVEFTKISKLMNTNSTLKIRKHLEQTIGQNEAYIFWSA